jgi:hypothetical protein
MKVHDIYYVEKEDKKLPVICYEFSNKGQFERILESVDNRNNRQSTFMSDGKYYLAEYITPDIGKWIFSFFEPSVGQAIPNDSILISVSQEAYGDWRYFFNRKEGRFIKEYYSIGD